MAADSVRVIVVDDQPSFRRAAATVIDLTDGFELVGEAADGDAGVALAGQLHPDLVLMDVYMPGAGGVDAARALQRDLPDVLVVLVSTYEPRDLPDDVQFTGARYLHKEHLGPDVLRSLWDERPPSGP